jgi:hypothetical protein
MQREAWTQVFFEYFCPFATSQQFRAIVSMKLATEVQRVSGINLLNTKKVCLSNFAGVFHYQQNVSSGNLTGCSLAFGDRLSAELDWSFESLSRKEVNPQMENLDFDDLKITIDYINLKTFLASYYVKPYKLPFKTDKYDFQISTRVLTPDPLKMLVTYKSGEIKDAIEGQIVQYILNRNEKIDLGKLSGRVIHAIRDIRHVENQMVFDFDFGLAGRKGSASSCSVGTAHTPNYAKTCKGRVAYF